ncbi:MAG: hypothetical protein RBS17_01760 [Coriobacteriia bacterium]|nr:hypothetical protein [Coriobacteriia bacterium]
MTQQSEIITLVLSVAFIPVAIWTYRGISLPHKPLLAWALGAMFGGYAATVIEGFIAPILFNYVEHLAYAIAGVCFATLGVAVLRSRVNTEGENA